MKLFINKNKAYTFLLISASTLALWACSSISLVPQNDLYVSTDELIEEDLTTTPDNGFKSPTEREGWNMVWTDEFDKPEIDTTKWNYEINGSGMGNNELQYYISSRANSWTRDGKLVIKAISQNYKGKFYTSARLNSKGKGDWKYGRMDVRAKLPVQQGVWPAIWMLPTDWVYGTWPQSGEIDIMEIIGQKPSTTHGTIHFGQPWPKNRWIGETKVLSKGDFSEEFHVFSVEWEENQIRWYLDDTLFCKRVPADLTPERWPFDQKFHMILNLAIGGEWPGPPDENTKFPKYMYVDYVRVYQKNEVK
jgi:beta-glucanase (GH16 family)